MRGVGGRGGGSRVGGSVQGLLVCEEKEAEEDGESAVVDVDGEERGRGKERPKEGSRGKV